MKPVLRQMRPGFVKQDTVHLALREWERLKAILLEGGPVGSVRFPAAMIGPSGTFSRFTTPEQMQCRGMSMGSRFRPGTLEHNGFLSLWPLVLLLAVTIPVVHCFVDRSSAGSRPDDTQRSAAEGGVRRDSKTWPLRNGLEVPVSRTYLPAVREASWS